MNHNLNIALQHANQGRPVFPCSPTKKPYVKNWQAECTTDPGSIAAHWRRFPDAIPALPCGPNNIVVIDQDNRDGGADGVNEWATLCERNHVNEVGCLVVETPSGGRHTYFKQADAQGVGNSVGKIAKGIDTRGEGGYVIAPGARLPDGRQYNILSGALHTCPQIPEDLRAFLARKAATGGEHASTRPRRTSAARSYALTALEQEAQKVRAQSVGQRNAVFNSAVFLIATMVPHYGIELDDFTPLKEAALFVGLSEEEVLATFASAFAAGQRNPRPQLDANIEPLVGLGSVTCKGEPLIRQSIGGKSDCATPWRSLANLQFKVFEPLQWVVPKVLPQGVTLLAGRPKLGKSWLALDLCFAVAAGGTALGVQCEEGDVLYAALEDNEPRLKARAERLSQEVWPARLSYLLEMPRADEGGVELIRRWLELAPAPRLIVIDVLAKVRSAKGRDDGSYDADYRAITSWKTLADEFKVAIVLIHHVRKMAAEDPLEMVSGTNGLTGAADAILILNRDSQGCTLSGRGRDLDEFEKGMQFDQRACRWTVLGAAPDIRRSDERKAILSTLSPDTPKSPTEIADEIKHPYGNTRFLLHQMVEAGEVEKIGRGKYVLPGGGANFANNGALLEGSLSAVSDVRAP